VAPTAVGLLFPVSLCRFCHRAHLVKPRRHAPDQVFHRCFFPFERLPHFGDTRRNIAVIAYVRTGTYCLRCTS